MNSPTPPPTTQLKPPLDLQHHYSAATKARKSSAVKDFDKLFAIPGMGNLAVGKTTSLLYNSSRVLNKLALSRPGMPNANFFPFDTLEAQVARPDRWTLTADPQHVQIPKLSPTPPPPATTRLDLETALQYGGTDGLPVLADFVRTFTRAHLHPRVPYAGGPQTLLTCGSTDGFAKTLHLLVDPAIPDQPLLCEEFMYSNVLAQVKPLGMRPTPVRIDRQGMCAHGPGGLLEVLRTWAGGSRPRLLYTVTTGHNPTGGVQSAQRRRDIYDICSRYDVIIVEDDPYWYLQFPSAAAEEAKSRRHWTTGAAESADPQEQEQVPSSPSSGFEFLDALTQSYLSIDTDGRVIRLDTFSKTIAPGCRLGWITAQPAFIERYLRQFFSLNYRLTEATTQQPSGFTQALVAAFLTHPAPAASVQHPSSAAAPSAASANFVRWLAGLRGVYEARMVRMCRALDAHAFLAHEDAAADGWSMMRATQLLEFAWPRGGMFVWVRVRLDAHPLYSGAVAGPTLGAALLTFLTRAPWRVVVMPGSMYAADAGAGEPWQFFRLCFAAEEEQLVEGCAERFGGGVRAFWEVTESEVRRLAGDEEEEG